MTLDPGWLLSSLAQSTAAIVAIVGGFLVSRLVQLSSEREGLRRQLHHTLDELTHAEAAYAEAHDFRRSNSERQFFGWVIDELAAANLESVDREAVLQDNIPRGSSLDEMSQYLDAVIVSIEEARDKTRALVRGSDTSELELRDLRDRGLKISDSEEDLYEAVVEALAAKLPAPRANPFGISSTLLRGSFAPDPVGRAADLRRLDDSIRDEQQLQSRVTSLEAVRDRTRAELEILGHPVGVTPAIVILAYYAVVGILVPISVLAIGVATLPAWASWLLFGLFSTGLGAVLVYIYWYAKSLKAPALQIEVDSR